MTKVGKSVSRYVGKRVGALPLLLLFLADLPTYRLTDLQAQETSVTVYSDGRVLVRRLLPVSVPRGTSTLAVDLGVREADPTSFVALDEGVSLKGTRVAGASGLEGSLRRSVGTDVLFRSGSDSAPRYVRGTLLSLDPPAVRTDGYVLYGMPGTPVFPDSLVQLQPRVEVTIEAAQAARGLRLMYLSSGLSWGASYALVLPRGGAGQAAITGAAQLQNGGAVALAGAQVQLLAGEVRRAHQPGPRPVMMRANAVEVTAVDVAEPSEEGLGGTHVYALPGTVDFVPGETRTVALFARAAAEVRPELVLRPQSGYGPVQWPDVMRDQHPEIGYRVLRPAASPFGATPLPAGLVRVYEPDESGRPQLVGEAAIGHTPAGRDVRVTTGTAFDVTAVRTQTAFERRGDRETYSSYRVELQNARAAQAVTVAVMDQCPSRCDILSSSMPGEQPTVSTVSFRVTVPANGSASLQYQLRARW